MIPALINKTDNSELIRDQIANILALEVVSQMALAVTASLDPTKWKLRVYVERSNPWEQFLNPDPGADRSPIVNVWFDSATPIEGASNTVQTQKFTGTFNIDVYGYGESKETLTGHTPGDTAAALEVQRAVRLVRNILFAAGYTYLAMGRDVVSRRRVMSLNAFQPNAENTPGIKIVGARLALGVEYIETSPQVAMEILEELSGNVTRAADGAVIAETEFDYT